MKRLCLLLTALAVATALLPAAAEEHKTSEAEARWQAGKQALEAGRTREARHFLEQALALEPANMAIVGDLLRTEGADEEAVRMWLLHAVMAGADDDGRFKPHKTWPKVVRTGLADAQAALKARAAALAGVAKAAAKLKNGRDLSVLRHLTALARELAADAPALGSKTFLALDKARERCEPESEKVIAALHKVMRKAQADKRWEDVLEAAQILHGLHQQAGQNKGAASTPTKELPSIVSAKRAARRALEAAGETVDTLETLRAVPEPERDAWSREHATWAHPGVAVSPTNLYRIETVCGIETLLVATEDIEYHHNRLAAWYGSDPFAERRGLLRLVRSQSDFESAGQPFWWAGGFQSGDITTVCANYTSRHGLSGVLTHELTHRFDGTIFPGLPAWLLEGRAVHTATCTADPHAPALDERRVSFGRFWKANSTGYGNITNIEALLTGTIADYRDNYDAGYALWVCLTRFQGFDAEQRGAPIFAPRVQGYLESFRKKRSVDPVERFTDFFVDGRDGRPADMQGFAAIFAQMLRDGAALDPPPWRQAWLRAARDVGQKPLRTPHVPIDDRATWPRDRSRGDPVAHGEQHAYAAGLLLERWKELARAYDAFEWALHVDEPVAAHAAHAALRSRAQGEAAAAWVMQVEAARLDAQAYPPPEIAAPGVLGDVHRRVEALVALYEGQEAAAREAARPRLARVQRAMRSRLLAFAGRPPLDPVSVLPESPDEEPPPPDCGPYVSELAEGAQGARWSPMDSRSTTNWHLPDQASIELGRRESGKTLTGTIRDAGVRRVFVRANRWHSGTYTVRTRVRFLSAHVSANLVIGYTRRDRGVAISLGGGDFAYATGRREEAMQLTGIHVGLSDLRPFDGSVSVLSRSFQFKSPREVFDIAVHVDGAFLRVQVNGRDALVHRRSTGDPIEGFVGFGLHSGLVRFEDPESRVHRVLGHDHVCPCATQDEPIRLDEPLSFPWSTCVGRRIEGLPLHPGGTFVVWYPAATLPAERDRFAVETYLRGVRQPFEAVHLPVAFRLVLPPTPADGPDFERGADYDLPEGHVHEHAGSPNLVAFLERQAEDDAQRAHAGRDKTPLDRARKRARKQRLGNPTWFMLDEHGVVRACGTWGDLRQALALAHHLAGW